MVVEVGDADGAVVSVLVATTVEVVVVGAGVFSLQAPSRAPSIIMNAKENKNVFKENIISDRLSRTSSEYTLIIDELSPLIKSQAEV